MRQRILSVLILVLFFVSLFLGMAPDTQAAGDWVDEFAQAFRNAVEKKMPEFEMDTAHPDAQKLLDDTFVRYPELYHFYGGASWITYPTYTEITVKLKNLHHTFSDISVADSLDTVAFFLMNAVEQGKGEVCINFPGADPNAALDEMFRRYPVLFHYYDSASWYTYQNRIEITIFLKNLQDEFHDIPVVDSEEDLFAVLAVALAELDKDVTFILANGYQITDDALNRIFSELQMQYHLAYMGHHGWSGFYSSMDNAGLQDYTFTFNYFYDLDAKTIQQWRNETEQIALRLAGSLYAHDMPDYLKLLLIHDWIVNNTRYNIENMDEVGNHTAYGVLVKGSSVCMGYAETINLLLQAAGIETRYVTGYGVNSDGHREGHAWNAVKLGNDWYMLDTTWDDPVTTDNSNLLLYDYFNVTSAQLAKNHEWDPSQSPVCNGTLYNADYVRQLAQNDPMNYTDYDASTLMTQEKAKQYFRTLLNRIPVVLPPTPAPPETQPPAEEIPETTPIVNPQPTYPAETRPHETQPYESIPEPTVSDETVPVPVIPPTPPQRENGGLWIVIAAIVLAGGTGTALFLFIRKKRQEQYSRKGYQQEFGLDNLPKRY